MEAFGRILTVENSRCVMDFFTVGFWAGELWPWVGLFESIFEDRVTGGLVRGMGRRV